MVFEDGVNWQPREPEKRGRHATFNSALEAVLAEALTEKDPFFDSLPDVWKGLFPGLPAYPGRYDDGKIVIYVRNAALSYVVRPKLRMIAKKLGELPNAPKKVNLRLEIHAQ